ncbi:DUF3467 domain-containing protein [archaeon]|nr:DUF3467 domain-containing protein [archaeon]MBT4350978.1 DUF3467 domain-containing protein [archaeon]MBT4647669.1 DUF3467 domain-containing protein [archaeon]MBT6822216.1 DUF3467 domain-containing protein [archaeon]MBT7391489.1 DUF3467 domain-containing protein [archaeon]
MAKKDQNKQTTVQKGVKFDIDNGPVFAADEVGVMHNPLKMIMDFRNVTPRVDIRNRNFQPIAIKHSVITMDPWTAKNLLDILKTNLNNYEKKFGKIKKPKALEIMEKEMKNNSKKSPNITNLSSKEIKDMPNYFG